MLIPRRNTKSNLHLEPSTCTWKSLRQRPSSFNALGESAGLTGLPYWRVVQRFTDLRAPQASLGFLVRWRPFHHTSSSRQPAVLVPRVCPSAYTSKLRRHIYTYGSFRVFWRKLCEVLQADAVRRLWHTTESPSVRSYLWLYDCNSSCLTSLLWFFRSFHSPHR